MKNLALLLAIIALFTALTSYAEEKRAPSVTVSDPAPSTTQPRKPDAGVDMTADDETAGDENSDPIDGEFEDDLGEELDDPQFDAPPEV